MVHGAGGTYGRAETEYHPNLHGRIATSQKVNIITVSNGLDFNTESSGGGSLTAPIIWAMLLKVLHGFQPQFPDCKI